MNADMAATLDCDICQDRRNRLAVVQIVPWFCKTQKKTELILQTEIILIYLFYKYTYRLHSIYLSYALDESVVCFVCIITQQNIYGSDTLTHTYFISYVRRTFLIYYLMFYIKKTNKLF